VHRVQHHWAHALACMAENELAPPVLAVSWDGTGFGPDGTIWGGEFLLAGDDDAFRRVAHLRQFRLPGGEAAVKEPRRTALGVLFAIWGAKAMQRRELSPVRDFSEVELRLIRQMLVKGLHAPLTSSAGRLFDAVASLTGLRQRASFEGQAAMELEFTIPPGIDDAYPFGLHEMGSGRPCAVDWRPAIQQVVDDVRAHQPAGVISARFHNGLAEAIVAVARLAGVEKVALTGGCFQNRYLTERCVARLFKAGFRAYWHQRVPPNDGGIALGQVMAAARAAQRRAGAPKEEGLVA
jgi:hydrogenase maturation protein HypF